MQRILLTLFSIGALMLTAHAQQDTFSQLTLSLGPASITRQDLIFSPFKHSGFAPITVGLKYEKNMKIHQFVRLGYAGFEAGLEAPYSFLYNGETETAYPHSFTFVDLDYGWGQWLDTKKQSLIGGSLNLDVQAMNYQYGRASFFGYYSTIGLDVWFRQHIQLSERHSLSAQIEVPLVSWYARSPYLVNDDEFIENIFSHKGFTTFMNFLGDGEIVSWNKLQTVNTALEYQYALSDKWKIGAAWQFAFIHASEPLPLTSVQHQFALVIGMRL